MLKRTLSLFLAVLTVFSLSVPVLADQEPAEKITEAAPEAQEGQESLPPHLLS